MSSSAETLFKNLKPWLETPELARLGPEARPGAKSRRDIEAGLAPLLRGQVPSRCERLIQGLLFLWHDHLDAAHSIAQSIEDPDGSLLHAMMHRREPDYSNAKYWLRRAGQHACYASIAAGARPLLAPHAALAARLMPSERWDAYAFVDACEEAEQSAHDSAAAEVLRKIQRVETEAFLQFLASAAV